MKRYLAESIGTFALVFAGTAAIVINELNGGVISHVGVALTFGLVVMAMIYSVGDVSGAHLNPAVTLGFWASGRMLRREVAPYVVSQSAGALVLPPSSVATPYLNANVRWPACVGGRH